MSQQRILSIEDVGHGILLVGPQRNLRVHTGKIDMGAVILTGADVVEHLIVLFTEHLPALGVFEYPVLERLAQSLLLLLGNGGLLDRKSVV